MASRKNRKRCLKSGQEDSHATGQLSVLHPPPSKRNKLASATHSQSHENVHANHNDHIRSPHSKSLVRVPLPGIPPPQAPHSRSASGIGISNLNNIDHNSNTRMYHPIRHQNINNDKQAYIQLKNSRTKMKIKHNNKESKSQSIKTPSNKHSSSNTTDTCGDSKSTGQSKERLEIFSQRKFFKKRYYQKRIMKAIEKIINDDKVEQAQKILDNLNFIPILRQGASQNKIGQPKTMMKMLKRDIDKNVYNINYPNNVFKDVLLQNIIDGKNVENWMDILSMLDLENENLFAYKFGTLKDFVSTTKWNRNGILFTIECENENNMTNSNSNRNLTSKSSSNSNSNSWSDGQSSNDDSIMKLNFETNGICFKLQCFSKDTFERNTRKCYVKLYMKTFFNLFCFCSGFFCF